LNKTIKDMLGLVLAQILEDIELVLVLSMKRNNLHNLVRIMIQD